MFQRRSKRFRRRPNGRNHSPRMNGVKDNLRVNLFPSDKPRNNNFRSSHNVEKMFEKYTSLAKEALSSGDKTLHENYLQHADHFMRLIADKKKLQSSNKLNLSENNSQKDSQNLVTDNNNLEKK